MFILSVHAACIIHNSTFCRRYYDCFFRRRDWEEDYDPDWKKNYVEEERPVGPDGLPAWTVITPEVCGYR